MRLLLQLPPRQRTAIVLRYWEELSEAETAEVMGCSVGTVKSATSRGLHRLRELSGIDYALARSAYHRYRRRRVAARAIAAAGTAAVAGAAATVFVSGSARPATQMQTTAYVVSHVPQALDVRRTSAG